MSKSAVEYFTAVPKLHNCAQAVAAGAGRADLVPAYAAMGGGRAPGGMCGALYAALQELPESRRAGAEEAFRNQTGAVCCRELKAAGVSCLRCVEIAADLLKK